MLNDEARERIRLAALRYPEPRAALLPALHIAQKEAGYVSEDAMRFIAGQLNVPESEVFGTATFYSLIRRSSSGRHVISICHNLPCTLLGAEPLIGHLKSRLGVDEGRSRPMEGSPTRGSSASAGATALRRCSWMTIITAT